MVIHFRYRGFTENNGALITELVVAMGILAVAMLPLTLGLIQDVKLSRAYYYKAVSMEVVDGEMEVLRSGEWKAYPAGTHAYSVRAQAATNLPPGLFQLTIASNLLRLEWLPKSKGMGGPVLREVKLP